MKKYLVRPLLIGAVISLANLVSAQDGTWATKAPMPQPRLQTAGVVFQERLIVIGGSTGDGAEQTPEIYDPLLDTWSFGSPAAIRRSSVAAAILGSKIYVAGGWINSDSSATTGALEVYDPSTDSWTSAAPMPTGRGQAAVAAIGGKMYVAGGRAGWGNQFGTLEIYDPIANTWSTGAPLPITVEFPGGAEIGGKLYVVGGFNFAGYAVTGALQIYDPVTDTWAMGAPLPTPRQGAMVGLLNGKLIAIGGFDGFGHRLTTVEVYDPDSNSWTTGVPTPETSLAGAVGVIGSQLFLAGGYGSETGDPFVKGTLYVFTPEAAPFEFAGFLAPIGGADSAGGSFANPLRTFKMGSTIPVKFTLSADGDTVLTGVHTLQAIKYSNSTTFGSAIDATPQDGATAGNEFRLSDGAWHFNLATKATGMSTGVWQLIATLSDGSQHLVWIQLK